LLCGAVTISSASDNFDATVILVNSEPGRAELANWNVIFYNARSVSWTALAQTRIGTLVVDAGLVGRATSILETDGDARLALLVADADGFVLQNLTGLSFRARSRLAGVLTGAVDARQVDRTFRISSARRLLFRTGQLSGRRDDQLELAGAGALVTSRNAFFVGIADRSVSAR
jgi:hypothetical protein